MASFPFGWSPSGIAYPSLPSKLRLPTPSSLESTGTGRGLSGGWTGKLSQHNYITHHQPRTTGGATTLSCWQMRFKVIGLIVEKKKIPLDSPFNVLSKFNHHCYHNYIQDPFYEPNVAQSYLEKFANLSFFKFCFNWH